MADGPTAEAGSKGHAFTDKAPPAAAPAAPAKPASLSWPKDFDPKKQGKGFAIAIKPALWALLHGSDPASYFAAIGEAVFDKGDPEKETAFGKAGAYMKHVGPEDGCPNCGARVSQITRNNGPICVGCGNVRIMGEEN